MKQHRLDKIESTLEQITKALGIDSFATKISESQKEKIEKYRNRILKKSK